MKKYIIEANGRQHYENHGFDNCGGRPLDEEIENDLIKKELALSNGIKEDNYIVIDCRKSKLEFIKQNILNSSLSKMFDLSKIDWLKCEEYTCSNLLKQACDLWNSGIHSTVEIGSLLKLDGSTIRKYLIKGTKVNLCKYNSVESKRYASTVGDFNQRKVINLSTLEVFDKIKIANKKYNTSKVGMACDGSRKSAGGHMWMYYDEYLKQGNIKKDVKLRNNKIICINNGEIFNSASECDRKSESLFGIKLHNDKIGLACKNGKAYNGYHFKYVSDLPIEQQSEIAI